MRGKFRLLGIFIPFLAIFLMSHNTFAFDVNTLVGLPSQVGFTSMNCNAGVTCNSSTNSGVFNQINVTFYTENSQLATLVAGRYVEFNVYLFKLQDSASMHAVLAGLTTSLSSNVKILSAHFETLDTNTGVIRIVGYVMNNTSTATLTFGSGSLVLRSSEEVRPGTWTEWQRQNISVDVDIDEQAIIDAIEESAAQQSEQADKEQAAIDNISEQTPQDISQSGSTENAQTSSLLATIQSFLTALTNVQSGSCSVDLPFPSFAGGTITVNICQGKDKTGNLVTIFGSITLIAFYIPLAWKLISMIYSEIRSFTNG